MDTPTKPTPQDLTDLRESNQARFRALAAAGTPIQVNGIEEHLLTFLIEDVLGPERCGYAFLEWEKKVAQNLDQFEAVVRQQKLLIGRPQP